jgi:hypothetical protein
MLLLPLLPPQPLFLQDLASSSPSRTQKVLAYIPQTLSNFVILFLSTIAKSNHFSSYNEFFNLVDWLCPLAIVKVKPCQCPSTQCPSTQKPMSLALPTSKFRTKGLVSSLFKSVLTLGMPKNACQTHNLQSQTCSRIMDLFYLYLDMTIAMQLGRVSTSIYAVNATKHTWPTPLLVYNQLHNNVMFCRLA